MLALLSDPGNEYCLSEEHTPLQAASPLSQRVTLVPQIPTAGNESYTVYWEWTWLLSNGMMGKWDFFFSSHTHTEPADLVLERNWDKSGLECIVKKISSLDLKMQLVEGFDPSASALLFYKDHFLQSKEEYWFCIFMCSLKMPFCFKKTTVYVTLTKNRPVWAEFTCAGLSLILGTSELWETLKRVSEGLFYIRCWGWEKCLIVSPWAQVI